MGFSLYRSSFLGAVIALAAGAASAAPDPMAKFAWLQGCWRVNGAEAGSVEHWTAPAGATMLGLSRTVKDGKTVAHEFLQIRAIDAGKFAYVAMPSGQAQATFPLRHTSDTRIVFENPDHDFPQRIIYRREGANILYARIEGTVKGKLKGINFPMQRTACEAS